MEIKVLKFVSFVENVLCVCRNVSFVGRITQVFVFLRVCVEISLATFNGIIRSYYYKLFEMKSEMLFFFSSITSSIIIILLSCYHSRNFKQLLTHLNDNHSYLKSNNEYRRKLKNILYYAIIISSIFFVIGTVTFIYSDFIHHYDLPGVNIVLVYLLHFNLASCDYRYVFEYIMLGVILEVMSEQLDCIARSVDDVKVNMQPELIVSQDTLKPFDEWCLTYTNIEEASKMFNNVFGIQLTVMIATVVFYFIIFLYSLTEESVSGNISVIAMLFYISTTILLMTTLTLLSRAAQRVRRSADNLWRRVAGLLNHSQINEEYYKSMRDLVRLIKTRPISTHAFGFISVDMTLLPSCVVFFTYYTVIVLQFNNIV